MQADLICQMRSERIVYGAQVNKKSQWTKHSGAALSDYKH